MVRGVARGIGHILLCYMHAVTCEELNVLAIYISKIAGKFVTRTYMGEPSLQKIMMLTEGCQRGCLKLKPLKDRKLLSPAEDQKGAYL